MVVSNHIENNCQVRRKEKVFSNRCNKPKCKKKELVPCICDICKLNFCLTHRHPADHDCKGPLIVLVNLKLPTSSLGGGGQPAADGAGGQNTEDEDRMLAMAIAESERLAAGQNTASAGGGDRDKSCRLQ